jgi:peptide/nickel transport system permease protein
MNQLTRYFLKRILQVPLVLLAVIVFNFTLIHLAPGDPILILVGESSVSAEYVQMLRQHLGLDRSIPEQLLLYIWSVAQGDMGFSFYNKQPVIDVILSRIPATLLLMITQYIIATAVGVFLGVTAARKPHSLTSNLTSIISLVGYSIPVFWLGQILLLIFVIQLGLLPAGGMFSLRQELQGIDYILDVLRHLVLPVICLGAYHVALVTRLTRASMLETLQQDFITAAEAKGLDERVVVYKHALRNALLPVVTVAGMSFGFILSGAILTESVFAWPGLGRLTYEAIVTRDYPVLMGMLIMVSVMVMIANLITDILYALLDPRITYI